MLGSDKDFDVLWYQKEAVCLLRTTLGLLVGIVDVKVGSWIFLCFRLHCKIVVANGDDSFVRCHIINNIGILFLIIFNFSYFCQKKVNISEQIFIYFKGKIIFALN